MKTSLSLIALAVALAVGTPVTAGPSSSSTGQNKAQQEQGQRQSVSRMAEQRKSIVTAAGTIVSRASVRSTDNRSHEVVKLRTPSGGTVIADLGETGTQPRFQRGDTVIVSGRAARVNGRPVVLASHAGVIQPVGTAAGGTRQAKQQGASDAGWVVLTFTPIAVVTAQDQRREALFGALDTNRDQRISRGEARGHPQISSNFDRIDRNGDGRLGWTEFGQLRVGGRQLQQQRQDAPGYRNAGGQEASTAAQKARQERATFRLLDDDRDAAISHFEAEDLPALADRFDQLDTDGNGALSRDEFRPGTAAAIWGGQSQQQVAGTR